MCCMFLEVERRVKPGISSRLNNRMRTAVIFGLLVVRAWPQDRTSAISGVVTDESGARVRGAGIVALHDATGKESPAITQSDGTYLLVKLELGSYTVIASRRGSGRVVTKLSFSNSIGPPW